MRSQFFIIILTFFIFGCKKEFPADRSINNQIRIDTSNCTFKQKNILGYWKLEKIKTEVLKKDASFQYTTPFSKFTKPATGYLIITNKSTYHTSNVTSGNYSFTSGVKDTISWNNPYAYPYGLGYTPAKKIVVEYAGSLSLILHYDYQDSTYLTKQTFYHTIEK